jgi:hypothetical protein
LDEVDLCATRAIDRLRALQRADGSFEGEVAWCPMILAQYVILRAFLRRPMAAPEAAPMIRHFEITRRPEGGWGLHAEAPSYVFVSTLAYVALRLLGVPADAPFTSEARRWLHAQPSGVLGIPSWGKFWLAMAGLYDYAGMNPCPPGAVPVAGTLARASRSPLLPHPLHLSRNQLSLRFAFPRRTRTDRDRVAARALPNALFGD